MNAADSGEEVWPELVRATKTIVVVDVVESVRLMQANEADVIDRWRRFVHEVRTQVLPAHQGRMVKSLGDGMLLEFENVTQAMAAAYDLHQRVAPYNVGRNSPDWIALRMGVHRAEIVIDGLDVYGSGVNLAARLATLAKPGDMVMSAEVRDELVCGLNGDVEDLGACFFKHLADPVRAFRWIKPTESTALALGRGEDEGLTPTLAVLPFRVDSHRHEALVAADLLLEEVVRSLGRTSFLHVISRYSSAAAAMGQASITEISDRLQASYIVVGQLDMQSAGRLRLDLRLEHVPSQTLIDVGSYATSLHEVLQGQDDLVPQAVGMISQAIVRRELERANGKPLPTLHAHSLLMSGIGLIHRCAPSDFRRAQLVLEALAERHGRHPHAHAWLGKWYAMRVVQGESDDPGDDAKRALDSARRALDADPSSALAHTMAGLVHGFLAHDLLAAQQHYEAALHANPNEPLAWLYTGTLKAWLGQGAAALAAARRALALAPLDPMRYYFESLAGLAALAAGEDELARSLSSKSLRANRLHTSTHRTLIVAQWRLGQEDEARETMQEMLRIEPRFTVAKYLARFPGGAMPMALENARIFRAAGAAP